MLKYRNTLRMEVLAARGQVDVSCLTSNAENYTELDRKIIRLASRTLKKSDKTAFFYAYHCCATWGEIQSLFHTHLNREVELETVQRYGERASSALVAAARSARELD